ncbi:NTP pyrophosphohydrolase [Streptomyces sp. SID3343]|uniref:NTP pyrophosphohydrolase n=1 Tax=Streptomyces sp. SID3343 TaxID=2690260 RepID=UPI0013710EB7|nr:NTP pyrophosphohydrolase [Streptomyces sp. SID3343]MYW02840.1 NTP pyrophosphohydrolase [Streptomyces sp. SID3343]
MAEQSQTRPAEGLPVLIVDTANVVGSVPDGWWKDRKAAAERLRDALTPLAARGLPPASGAPEWACDGPLEVVMVVEGAARGVADTPEVRVVAAEGSGDDRLVRLAAAERDGPSPRRCLVVTADRELRSRVSALGADVIGPRAVRPR